jgi:hypothetical protein
MNSPQYARINPAELKDIEAEIGHSVSEELAYWIIRHRIIREAVARMMAAMESNQTSVPGTRAEIPSGAYHSSRDRISARNAVFV